MIVSRTHGYIFIHIPKNGGTTVESLLMNHLNSEQDLHISKMTVIPENRNIFGIPDKTKLMKHIIMPHLHTALGAKTFDSLFSFSISRNPFARCFSAFKFAHTKTANEERVAQKKARISSSDAQRENRKKFLEMSFDEICKILPQVAIENGLFRPQSYWVPRPDSIDFMGRLENLAEDLSFVYAKLGLPLSDLSELPVANQKTVPGAWRGMSAESAGIIRNFYAADFERLGYSPDVDAPDGAPFRPVTDRREARLVGRGRFGWTAAPEQKIVRPPRPPRPARSQDGTQPKRAPREPLSLPERIKHREMCEAAALEFLIAASNDTAPTKKPKDTD
jgi:hypothetical protein